MNQGVYIHPYTGELFEVFYWKGTREWFVRYKDRKVTLLKMGWLVQTLVIACEYLGKL